MMERLLAAPGETLTLVELRHQAALDEPTSESDFKLLLYSLTTRGLVHVAEPTATLLSAGKDYLVRERERVAVRHAKQVE